MYFGYPRKVKMTKIKMTSSVCEVLRRMEPGRWYVVGDLKMKRGIRYDVIGRMIDEGLVDYRHIYEPDVNREEANKKGLFVIRIKIVLNPPFEQSDLMALQAFVEQYGKERVTGVIENEGWRFPTTQPSSFERFFPNTAKAI